MATMQGVVQKVKSVTRGKYNFIELMVGGQWYTIKFCEASPVNEGENIQFTFDTKINGQYTNLEVDKKSIVKLAAPVAAPKAKAAYAKTKDAKDAYWVAKEERDLVTQKTIQYQAARNSAIEVVKIAQAAGVLELPKTKNKQLESIVSLVETIADGMFLKASDTKRLDSLKGLAKEVNSHKGKVDSDSDSDTDSLGAEVDLY